MRVLVTGGAGFIGSRLVRALVNAGKQVNQVVVADNLVTAHSVALISDVIDRVEFVHAHIRVAADLDRLPPGAYDRVYHLAASFANALSVEYPQADLLTNVEGTRNV